MTRASLSPERWAQVQELLLEALQRPAAEREAFLARASVDDPALQDEVRSLLVASDDEGLLPDTLERPAPAVPLLQWVGPYHLLRELGRGGMGTVYLAEREGEGFTQRVALKLMRPDYADPRIIAALARERRILARLEHPGIARFIDGGTTGSGQPFIAMEYVDGTPLLQHAEAAGLDVRGRVALLKEVCGAVQHAHRQLVVHRDLKPGKILVGADGRAKLLDFGIATVLDDPSRGASPDTAPWLTPAYASPEQVRRQPVSTVTDVYALGIILYELLSGRSPHDLKDGSLRAITEAICEQVPEPPSSAARRAGHPDRARVIAGDLDHVVMRALAKSPGERYGSVEQLCDDLQAWLDHLPVRAGPDSVGRRARRFVLRHRTLVAAGAITFAALVAGLSATLWQARRAGLERDRAQQALVRSEEVTRFLLSLIESADPRRTPGGDTTTGRAIRQLGLARVEELKDQPIVQADVLDALGRVLGTIGQYERSTELHLRAVGLRRAALGVHHPDVAPSIVALGTSLRRRSRYVQAEARYREALALQQAALGIYDARTGETIMELAYLMPYRGRMAEAESLYAVAQDVFTRTVGPDDRRTLLARQRRITIVRVRDVGLAEAEARALLVDAERALGPDDPFTANLPFHLGDYIALQRPDDPEAEWWFREGIARVERRSGRRTLELIHGLHSLAEARIRRGDYAEAESLLQRSLGINEALLGPAHAGTAGALGMLASLYERTNRLAEAEQVRLEVLRRFESALGPGHSDVAEAKARLARLAYRMGDNARAEQLWRESIDIAERALGPEHASVLRSQLQLAAVLQEMGRTAVAKRLCQQGTTTINRLYPMAPVQQEVRAESPHCAWDDLPGAR